MSKQHQEELGAKITNKEEAVQDAKSEKNQPIKEENVVAQAAQENIQKKESDNESDSKDMRGRLNEMKDGMAETFEKVKKGAKDGFKKIKSKAQKKKISG